MSTERTTMTMTLIENLEQERESWRKAMRSGDSDIVPQNSFGAMKIAIDIVKQHTGLISLADRKPTIDGYYLVRYERPWAGNTKILKKFDVVKFENGRFQILDEYITHWQPLPRPPSEAQDD